jgi:hypothetical protein
MYSLVNVLGPTAVSMLQGEGSDIAKSFQIPVTVFLKIKSAFDCTLHSATLEAMASKGYPYT